nr:hypothetical protein [uncultured Psychroserpens sp.]
MKKTLFILMAIALFNCSSDDYNENEDPQNAIPEATILGRWVPMGFETTIRYEFTETKRFNIYSTDGTFPTLEEFNQENPGLVGYDWYYEDDKIVVDLNFGNLSTLTPQFTCDNYAIKWLNDDGEVHGIYFREGYDISSCSDIN